MQRSLSSDTAEVGATTLAGRDGRVAGRPTWYALFLAAGLAVFGLLPTPATAAPMTYTTTLSGAAETPANASAGTGTATVTFDVVAHTMTVSINFSGLTGNTTAAFIHCCVVAPGNAGVVSELPTFSGFPLGVTSGTGGIGLASARDCSKA